MSDRYNVPFMWGLFKVITLGGIIVLLVAQTVIPLLVGWAGCTVLLWFATGMSDSQRPRIRDYDEVADDATDRAIEQRRRQQDRERRRRNA